MRRPASIAKILIFVVACYPLCALPSRLSAQDAAPPAGSQPTAKPEVATLRPPPADTLEDGTPVKLRLTAAISSASATTGQTIDFKVVEAVRVHDLVVIPEGGIAWATVTEAQHKRHMGRGGKLNIVIDRVRLADGERAPLRAVKEVQGGGHVGAMTTGMVATGILFFPVAPLFLFMHGKDVTIPEGTEVTAYINGNFVLDRARFQSPDAGPPGAAAPAVVPADSQERSEVSIRSAPPGADIILNGQFVGNTPSTLRLLPGVHKLRIEKPGYQPWEKDLTVTGAAMSSVTVDLAPNRDSPPPLASSR